jgi:hypothetical protein
VQASDVAGDDASVNANDRSRAVDRVVALSDGVFAIAMTLLVLNLASPPAQQGPTSRTRCASSASIPIALLSVSAAEWWWTALGLAHVVAGRRAARHTVF